MDLWRKLTLTALKRDIGELVVPSAPGKLHIELGGHHEGAPSGLLSFNKPDWVWPEAGQIPAADNSAEIIHAYHFMEHIQGEEAIDLLKEIQRVLTVGGIFQYGIPHYVSEMAHHDLTHKSFWTESTFKNLFDNPYYSPAGDFRWNLRVRCQVIMGVVYRNLILIGQLEKFRDDESAGDGVNFAANTGDDDIPF